MIENSVQLEALLDRLRAEPRIAFDTEADSLHCYFEKLCLVQVALPGRELLIDPLAGFSICPFFENIQQKKLVIHGAEYDLRLIRREMNFRPRELFDTALAAKLCGILETGLAALVQRFFGITISKSHQKANWARRPLSQGMEEYALLDVRYLLDLADRLEALLREKGRFQWYSESRDRMLAAIDECREKDREKAWRISGSSRFCPKALAILRHLWLWRDREAQAWNRPCFHVMGNQDLLSISAALAEGRPFSTPRLHPARKVRFDVAVQEALALPPYVAPRGPGQRMRTPRPTKEAEALFDSLRTRRDKAAETLGMDPGVVASRASLEAAASDPETPLLMRWQREALGIHDS